MLMLPGLISGAATFFGRPLLADKLVKKGVVSDDNKRVVSGAIMIAATAVVWGACMAITKEVYQEEAKVGAMTGMIASMVGFLCEQAWNSEPAVDAAVEGFFGAIGKSFARA